MVTWEENQDQYSDQSTPLMVVGGLLLAVAGLCLLGAVVVLAMNVPNAKPAAGLYAVAIFPTAALGVGLLLRKRWARAVAEAGAWIALAASANGIVVLVTSFGSAKDAGRIAVVVGGIFLVVLGVIEGGLAFYLGSRNARKTCEFYDPVPRWTDPLPILTLVLVVYLFFAGATSLAAAAGPAIAYFGRFLPLAAGRAISVGLGLAWMALAWALARGRGWAWWVILLLGIVTSISGAITAIRVPISEIYARSGMTPDQIRQIEALNMVPDMKIATIVPLLGFLALILAERVFRKKAVAP